MTKETNTFKPFSIREVFADKSPRMAKLVPGFVYNYISRILHLDYINGFLEKNGHEMGVNFVYKAVEDFHITEHAHNTENIPDAGRFIFASNHPLGGFDSLLLMRNVDENRRLRIVLHNIIINYCSINSRLRKTVDIQYILNVLFVRQ